MNRQPSGIPVGGQFAAAAHTESEVSLRNEFEADTSSLDAWIQQEEAEVYRREQNLGHARASLAARQILSALPQAKNAVVSVEYDDGSPRWVATSISDGEGNSLTEEQIEEANEILFLNSGHYVVHTQHVLGDLNEWAARQPEGFSYEDLTPAQSAQQRVTEALKNWDQGAEDPQEQIQDMLVDIRHFADKGELDFYEAMDGSYERYRQDRNDPVFTNGF